MKFRLLVVVIGLLILAGGFTGLVDDAQAYLVAIAPTNTPSPLDDPAGFVPVLEPIPTVMPTTLPRQTELDPQAAILHNSFTQSVESEPLAPTEAVAAAPTPAQPERLTIPAIQLDAPIVPALQRSVTVAETDYFQWLAPDEFASGWHTNSARLGEPGNLVLNGHHNVHGQVFRDLVNLSIGDRIVVSGGGLIFEYEVANIMILPERNQPVEQRIENARWIEPSVDTRLTLITCWPYESNTHRLVVVARPVSLEGLLEQAH